MIGRIQRHPRNNILILGLVDRYISIKISPQVKRMLFKQKAIIFQLEREKTELETLVKCAESRSFQKKDEMLHRNLQEQLNEYDYIEYNIKKENQELKELQEKIEKTEKELIDLKNKHQIRDSCIEEVKKQARIDENLETRLHVVGIPVLSFTIGMHSECVRSRKL